MHARLLDEDQPYLCHPRTMYRVFHDARAVRERQPQAKHPTYAKPELLATAPNQVWTWDLTWLRGPERYVYYPLYVIINLFSRFSPGGLLAHEENGELAKQLITKTCKRQQIDPGSLTLHADRGPVPVRGDRGGFESVTPAQPGTPPFLCSGRLPLLSCALNTIGTSRK